MRRPAHGEQAAPAFFRWQTESSDASRSGAFQLSRFPFPPDRDRSLGRSALATPTLSRRFPGHSRHSSQFHTLRTTVQAPTKAKRAPDIGVKPRYCPFLSFRQGSCSTRSMPRQPRIQRRSTGPSGDMNDTKAPPTRWRLDPSHCTLHSSMTGFQGPILNAPPPPKGHLIPAQGNALSSPPANHRRPSACLIPGTTSKVVTSPPKSMLFVSTTPNINCEPSG